MIDLNKLHKKVLNLAEESAKIALASFGNGSVNYNLKSDNSIVTDADKKINSYLIENLQKALPESGFVAEESSKSELEQYNWIIDPIDGTSNYFRGFDLWGISIALYDGETCTYALIYYPRLVDKYFFLIRGEGLKDSEGKIIKTKKLNEFKPSLSIEAVNRKVKESIMTSEFAQNISYKTFGAFVYDGYCLFKGSIDLLIAQELSFWDVAAVIPMAEAIGLQVKYIGDRLMITDSTAKKHTFVLGKPEMVDRYFDEVHQIIKSFNN